MTYHALLRSFEVWSGTWMRGALAFGALMAVAASQPIFAADDDYKLCTEKGEIKVNAHLSTTYVKPRIAACERVMSDVSTSAENRTAASSALRWWLVHSSSVY